jgi:uncharacterized protein
MVSLPKPVSSGLGRKVILLGLLAFTLLAVRFSPNWVAFYNGVRDARLSAATSAQRTAIDETVLTGYSARGYYVTQQALNLRVEISDPNHRIVRWRLLIPAIGHVLHLPGWFVLGLAHLGCLVLIITFVGIGSAQSAVMRQPAYEAVCFGIIAGASAPFFSSMGLLGYYDAWLALALIGVGFARARWMVVLACLLAPWIDERFVLGLPLALCVRWIRFDHASEFRWHWFRREALLPILIVTGYAFLRLNLGGSGGSQSVSEYLNEFVFALNLSFINYIAGAWHGLRLGWVLAGAAVVGSWIAGSSRQTRAQAILLTLGTIITGLSGLFTALDLSRSMVLLVSVVPLGWMYASQTRTWNRFHVAPLLAIAALALPAKHVVADSLRPVDTIWSPPTPLTHFQCTLGSRYLAGNGVVQDSAEAVKWFRQAAERGLADAQYNLALMCVRGEGTAKDSVAAVTWYRRAAEQHFIPAQHALAVMYAVGDGTTKDANEAAKWYREAAERGHAASQSNLGVKYLQGVGVAQNSTEAAKWFRKAAEQGYTPAQSNLAQLYFRGNGVVKDLIQARAWWQIAAARGFEDAQAKLSMIEAMMSAEEKAQSVELARTLSARHAFGQSARPSP